MVGQWCGERIAFSQRWQDRADMKWVGSGAGTGRLQGRSEELLGRFTREAPRRLPRPVHIATKLAPYPWRVTPGQFVAACRSGIELASKWTHATIACCMPHVLYGICGKPSEIAACRSELASISHIIPCWHAAYLLGKPGCVTFFHTGMLHTS